MSEPGRWAKTSSCISASLAAPGILPARLSPSWVSGQIRNRSWLLMRIGPVPNTSKGTCLKRIVISVAVTGMVLPARMRIGTPAQRQVSRARRTATNDSVVEPGATPSTSR